MAYRYIIRRYQILSSQRNQKRTKCFFSNNNSALCNSNSNFKAIKNNNKIFEKHFLLNNNLCAFYSTKSIFNISERVQTDIADDLIHLRTNLYPETQDSKLIALFEANSIQKVLDIVEELIKNDKFTVKFAAQAFVSIYDLYKFLSKCYDLNILNQIKSNLIFQQIIANLKDNYNELDTSSLSACLLGLGKMEFNILEENELSQLILNKLILSCKPEDLMLDSKSRLFTCLRSQGVYGCLMLAPLIQNLYDEIPKISTDLELRLMTLIVRSSIKKLLNENFIEAYISKTIELLNSIELENITLLKIFITIFELKNLEFPSLKEKYDLNQLFLMVSDQLVRRVDELSEVETFQFQKFLEAKLLEPENLIEAISRKLSQKLKENPTIELLACLAPLVFNIRQRMIIGKTFSEINEIRTMNSFSNSNNNENNDELALSKKKEMEEVDEDEEEAEDFFNFNKQKKMKIYNIKIFKAIRSKDWNKFYDQFWESIELNPKKSPEIVKFAFEYFNFSFNLNYRNFKFEFQMKDILNEYMFNYDIGVIPTIIQPFEFARLATFLIAFGNSSDPIFNLKYFRLIDQFVSQMKNVDLALMSRGLEFQLQNGQSPFSRNFRDKILDICSIIETQLGLKYNQNDALLIAKSLMSIKRNFSPIFEESLKSTKCTDTRSVRELINIQIQTGFYDPALYESMYNFILKNKNCKNDLAGKFSFLSYILGIEIEPDFSKKLAQIIEENQEKNNSLSLLQSALSLCFHNELSTTLINDIFSPKFLDILDIEISASLGSINFPFRVRKNFMELNRAICIEMPEAKVPWFHEKFCKDYFTNLHRESLLQSEIGAVLGEIIDKSYLKKNEISPYFYHIDFLLEFDKSKRPIKQDKYSRYKTEHAALSKVAIIILNQNSFTKNVRKLRGENKFMKKHLEILGYRVFFIDPQIWNSMYMSEPYAKYRFLEERVFENNI